MHIYAFDIITGAIKVTLLSGIKDKFNNVRQDRANKADFKRMLIAAVSDGKLTDSELNTINQLAQQYNIEEEDFLKINVEVYKAAFQAVVSDGIITEEEERNIQEIQNVLMVDVNQIPQELQIIDYHRQLRQIQQGYLPTLSINGLILKSNEVTHFLIEAGLLEERVVRRGYQGGSAGVNIRVAKGVNFRVGQQKGRMISETGIVEIDTGSFVVTNQRVMFVGSKKSFSYPFNQLIGYQVFTNGIDISTAKGVTRNLTFKRSYDSDVLQLILMHVTSN